MKEYQWHILKRPDEADRETVFHDLFAQLGVIVSRQGITMSMATFYATVIENVDIDESQYPADFVVRAREGTTIVEDVNLVAGNFTTYNLRAVFYESSYSLPNKPIDSP